MLQDDFQFVIRRLYKLHNPGLGPYPRLREQERQNPSLGAGLEFLSPIIEGEFSQVGPDCDLLHLDETSQCVRWEGLTPLYCAHLLSITLEIGFRLAAPGRDQPTLRLDHASHRGWVFETTFSSHDDEVIADAVCAWVADHGHTPPGSFVHYFAKRVEDDTPFSPRLRWASICAIERIWRNELKVSVLETVRLLDRLDVDVDDVAEEREWVQLLVDVICSPGGAKSLSFHYWRFLDKLVLFVMLDVDFEPRGMEVVSSLEEAEDWEKLEAWMVIAWRSPQTKSMEDVGRVTLKLLLRRPCALPRFEHLCERILRTDQKAELQRICDQARTGQSGYPPV